MHLYGSFNSQNVKAIRAGHRGAMAGVVWAAWLGSSFIDFEVFEHRFYLVAIS
ncbi:hypothetical protein J3R74_001429 [Puniceicoccus vermicola]